MRRDPLAFLTQLAREYGDVARFRMGPVELHLLNRPEWIRDLLVTHAASFHKGRGLQRARRLLGDGLLTSENPKHLRQRRMMQPAFHHQRIKGYGDVMAEHAARTVGPLEGRRDARRRAGDDAADARDRRAGRSSTPTSSRRPRRSAARSRRRWRSSRAR